VQEEEEAGGGGKFGQMSVLFRQIRGKTTEATCIILLILVLSLSPPFLPYLSPSQNSPQKPTSKGIGCREGERREEETRDTTAKWKM
jgi:hypothetical protein